jgi:hypothetical protein
MIGDSWSGPVGGRCSTSRARGRLGASAEGGHPLEACSSARSAAIVGCPTLRRGWERDEALELAGLEPREALGEFDGDFGLRAAELSQRILELSCDAPTVDPLACAKQDLGSATGLADLILGDGWFVREDRSEHVRVDCQTVGVLKDIVATPWMSAIRRCAEPQAHGPLIAVTGSVIS